MARGQQTLGDYSSDDADTSSTDTPDSPADDNEHEHDDCDAADTDAEDADELSPGPVKDLEQILGGVNDVSAYITEQGTIDDPIAFGEHAESTMRSCIERGSAEDIRIRDKWGVRFTSDYVSGEIYYDQSNVGGTPNTRAELTVQHGHDTDESSTVEIILPCLTLPERIREDVPLPDNRELAVDSLKSDETRIINISESEIPKEETVYIGCSGGSNIVTADAGMYTQFGNPHTADEHCSICGTRHSREEAIERYKAVFAARLQNDPAFHEEVESLRGEILACWCKPEPCHGDVIKAYLNGAFDVGRWAEEFPIDDIGDVSESGYGTIPVWIDVELPEDWEPDPDERTPRMDVCGVMGGRTGGVCEREPDAAFYHPIDDRVSWFCPRHAAAARDGSYGELIDLAEARPEVYGEDDSDESMSISL